MDLLYMSYYFKISELLKSSRVLPQSESLHDRDTHVTCDIIVDVIIIY